MGIPDERIERLAAMAREATRDGEYDRSREYVRTARRIAERHRVGLPRRFGRFTCDACDVYLAPGVNARIRLSDGHVVVRCDCGELARFPYRD